MKSISVILPCYNEADSIKELLNKISLNLKDFEIEIIVIDDASNDETKSILEEFSQNSPILNFICLSENIGLAKSVKLGIIQAKKNIIVVMDSDFNHLPSDIIRLVTYTNENNFVTGSRFVHRTIFDVQRRYLFSFLFNKVIKIILPKMDDRTSGFFACRREFLDDFLDDEIFSGYGEYFIRLTNRIQRKFEINEIAINYGDRMGGKSKSKKLKMIFNYLKVAYNELKVQR